MGKPKTVKCLVANGALLQAPAYETHYRGSNWLAVIDIEPTLTGGLSRRWANRGKGQCLYLVEQIALFDPVEFGADYTTQYGNKKRSRWYGVVVQRSDDFLVFEQCETGADAVLRSKALRASPEALALALEQDKQALIERAAKLEQQIQELRSPAPEVVEAPSGQT